jgi:choline-sulfatase
MASNPCRSAVSVFGRLFAGRKPCHACSDVSPESRSVPKRTAPGLAAILVAVVVLGASGCERGAPGPLCPGCNVVLVSMDTLRSDHLGAYGYDRPVTPAIDRLAARSVVFADAIGQSSWTRPAHFSMFTGLYPSEHGVVAMAGRSRLPAGVVTLAGVLSAHGWATAGFTGGANVSAHFGFDDGFDVYETRGKRMLDNLEPALDWLERHVDQRFFLFFHGLDAHRPYVSEPVDRRALGLPEPEPESDARSAAWRGVCRADGERDPGPLVDAYDAAAHRGDRALGVLLDALRESAAASRTVVIVTSDHGEELVDHGGCFHIRTLYREIVQVPLIVHVPNVDARVVAGVVPASVSVAPTVLDLLGVNRSGIPGPTIADILAGAEPGFGLVVSETASRFQPYRDSGLARSLTTDDEKLVHWVDAGRVEYFDLRSDPLEQNRLLVGPRLGELARSLESFVARHSRISHGSEDSRPLPGRLRRELKRLGYSE